MYKIVGADQREYGPATSEQVREWITQGRANGLTLATFEGSPWKPLSTYPEFADALRTTVPPPVGQPGLPPIGSMAPLPGASTNTAAVSGLILSIIGTCFCCSPFALIGVILCAIGWAQIQKAPERYTTSTVIPIVGIVVGLLHAVLAAIAIASGALEHVFRNFAR